MSCSRLIWEHKLVIKTKNIRKIYKVFIFKTKLVDNIAQIVYHISLFPTSMPQKPYNIVKGYTHIPIDQALWIPYCKKKRKLILFWCNLFWQAI